MHTLFPFGFPAPTAGYLMLYVLTLVIHVLFMNYVLAGSTVLGAVGLWRWSHRGIRSASPIRELLRDWLPFVLSAAITAGIAPLLFVQVLYRHAFYTANLLLLHRWMAILPVLIVAFYLLYLLKSRALAAWRPWQRALTGTITMLCFWFVAYSWTENHLLSLQPSTWTEFYATGQVFYWNPLMIPRLSAWVLGAFPTMALMLAWQIRHHANNYARRSAAGPLPDNIAHPVSLTGTRLLGSPWAPDAVRPAVRTLAIIALVGLALSGAGGLWYYSLCDRSAQATITGPLAAGYLLAAALGGLVQAAGWLWILRRGRLHAGWLIAQSIGLTLTLLGMTVAREALRLSALPIAELYEQHAAAGRVGGLWTFLGFLLINAVLILWCIRLVRRGRSDRQDDPHPNRPNQDESAHD